MIQSTLSATAGTPSTLATNHPTDNKPPEAMTTHPPAVSSTLSTANATHYTNTNNNNNHQSHHTSSTVSSETARSTPLVPNASSTSSITAVATPHMSTSALENHLRHLREQSQQHSTLLTQKLATGPTGQHLLHMGTSLGTLPPALHSLLQQLHPVLVAAESTEKALLAQLQPALQTAREIRLEQGRVHAAYQAAEWMQDLQAAEQCLARSSQPPHVLSNRHHRRPVGDVDPEEEEEEEEKEERREPGESDVWSTQTWQDLDRASSLERTAHTTLGLMHELQAAQASLSNPGGTAPTSSSSSTDPHSHHHQQGLPRLREPLPPSTEMAHFWLKLSPRIRRLEHDATTVLCQQLEAALKQMMTMNTTTSSSSLPPSRSTEVDSADRPDDLLHLLGHYMRGLVLLGKSVEVEAIFARVAMMPMIRSHLSVGRLDQGGARGQCSGLQSLLEDMATNTAQAFGPILLMSEDMFRIPTTTKSSAVTTPAEKSAGHSEEGAMEVDLLTAGVWVPLATALMADAGIKMAIFSPGIASILQANYTALDTFLSKLALRLLKTPGKPSPPVHDLASYEIPYLPPERIKQAQDRIFAHAKTAEFYKKWNLPIYYQLRFGECCTRLNKALDRTQREGWIAEVFTGSTEQGDQLRRSTRMELPLFLELYDVMWWIWRPDVILRPLTNRFLRGAVQLFGRLISFVSDGMDGIIKFGEEPREDAEATASGSHGGDAPENGKGTLPPPPSYPTRRPYSWGESEEDVAAVSWELSQLNTAIRREYAGIVCSALRTEGTTEAEEVELKELVHELLLEASERVDPLIDKAWNETIVNLLTTKCSTPLGAVKGVAATYRMTNRPPPTQASPFVATILRPVREFAATFSHRTPDRVGLLWKHRIVATVADRYAFGVDELLATVQRTEAALQNRRAKRSSAGGMSDGEKVKLQLYLDYQMFSNNVRELGLNPSTMVGLSKLQELTAEGEILRQQAQNGS